MRRETLAMTCGFLLVLGLPPSVAGAEGLEEAGDAWNGNETQIRWIDPTASKPGPDSLLNSRIHWRERFEFDEEFRLSDQVSLAFETGLVDLRDRLVERSRQVDPSALLLWERNTVGDAAIRLGALGGRLHLTTHYGWSRYDRSLLGIDSFTNSEDPRLDWTAQRTSAPEARLGQAFAQGLDASLWNSDTLEVSVFGSYRHVDANFVLVGDSGKRRKGFFAGSPGRKIEYGGKLRLGPVHLTLAREESRRWLGKDRERLGPTHHIARAAATVSLQSLRERAGNALGKPLAHLLPTSVWVSVAQGEIDPKGESAVEDATSDTTFGVSWDGANWSMNLDYWRSLYDNRQPGAQDMDWIGEGAYLGCGYYASRWDVYATAGFSRYANEAAWSRSVDLNLDSSFTVSIRPENLPDIAATVSYGGYQSDYLAWDAESRTQSLGLAASLDFTKLLPADSDEDRPTVRAAYRFTATRTQDGFTGSSERGEHAVLLLVRLRF